MKIKKILLRRFSLRVLLTTGADVLTIATLFDKCKDLLEEVMKGLRNSSQGRIDNNNELPSVASNTISSGVSSTSPPLRLHRHLVQTRFTRNTGDCLDIIPEVMPGSIRTAVEIEPTSENLPNQRKSKHGQDTSFA